MVERFRAGIRRSALRRGSLPLVLALFVGSVVVVSVGSASALPASTAEPSKVLRFAAPYSGTVFGVTYTTPTGCGATARAPVLPSANLTTGVMLGSGSVTASACGGSNSSMILDLNPEIVSSAFPARSGVYNLTATWNVSVEFHLSANSGTDPASATASFLLIPTSYLVDNTNGSVTLSANEIAYQQQLTTGTFAHAFVHLRVTSSLEMTLRKGHTYNWGVILEAQVSAVVAPGGVDAAASFNMGSGVRAGTLVSVVLKPVAT